MILLARGCEIGPYNRSSFRRRRSIAVEGVSQRQCYCSTQVGRGEDVQVGKPGRFGSLAFAMKIGIFGEKAPAGY